MAYMPLNSPQKSMSSGSPTRNADVDNLVAKYVNAHRQGLPIPLKRLGNEKDKNTVIYQFGTQQVQIGALGDQAYVITYKGGSADRVPLEDWIADNTGIEINKAATNTSRAQ